MIQQENISNTRMLFELIIQEKNTLSDKLGYTPLIRLAKRNAELDILAPKKIHAEQVASEIVEYLTKFDETDFSNLELYIHSSNFSKNIIRDTFFKFLVSKGDSLDLIIKANLIRLIQGLSDSLINERIITSISELKSYEPWLYAEILIDYNWETGVDFISNLLDKNYDGSYLLSLLPEWKSKKPKENIEFALNRWYPLLVEKDKELVGLYSKNYGFALNDSSGRTIDNTLAELPQFDSWLKSPHTTLFKTLQSNVP